MRKLVPPAWMARGTWDHLLGTDRFGRDVLSRIIYGSRVSFVVSLLAIGVAGTRGTFVGLIAAYRGGITDAILMRLTDVRLSLPTILIAVVLVAVSEPSFRNVVLVISLLLWPRFARQIRGETLGSRSRTLWRLPWSLDVPAPGSSPATFSPTLCPCCSSSAPYRWVTSFSSKAR